MTWLRMTDKMREAMGYDSYGNAQHLLSPQDDAELDRGIPRAAGSVVCSHCGVTFIHHPVVQGALWATRTCKDGIVKL